MNRDYAHSLQQAEVLNTVANTLRYFESADLLTVATPDYFCERTHTMRTGRGVGLDLAALSANPEALGRLITILRSYLKK